MEEVANGCDYVDEEETGEDEENHPLFNSVVLRNIFQYGTVKDLKNSRLVCSLWHELASPYLQEKSQVLLQEDLFRETSSIRAFLVYVNDLGDPDILFFRNYKISLLAIDKEKEIVIKFWKKVGPSMHALEMSWCRFHGVEMVRNVMFNWTPNLKRLCLRDSTFFKDIQGSFLVENEVAEYDTHVPINPNMKSLEFYGGEARVGPPLTWREVIVAYPNLQQLLLNNLTIHGINNILSEIEIIRRTDTSKLNIKKLNIFNGDFAFGELTEPIAQLLMDLKLPITHLNLDVGMTTSDLTLASILKTFSKTLRHLSMYRGPFSLPFTMFPFDVKFTELITLELSESVTVDFNFLRFMPKLRKLSICDLPDSEPPIMPTDIISNTEPFFSSPLAPLSVYLRTFQLDYDCCPGNVKKLVRWFPYLKELRMYLNNDSFRLICGEWRDLEELEILGDGVTDEGLTGLEVSTLDSKQLVMTKKSLSVCSFKSLRVFVMKNHGMSTAITDLSVHHGFSLMPRLYRLELCSNLITNEGWEKLHGMPNLSYLKPSDGAWDESKCSKYAKDFH